MLKPRVAQTSNRLGSRHKTWPDFLVQVRVFSQRIPRVFKWDLAQISHIRVKNCIDSATVAEKYFRCLTTLALGVSHECEWQKVILG